MGQTHGELPDFHPQTVLRDWGNGHGFRIADAQTGVCVFGATGSGKTSGPAKHLAYGYLANDFGGLVLCAKREERVQWEQWAADCGRTEDLIIFDSKGAFQFNFLDWETSRAGEGGGLTINTVALLDEVGQAVAGTDKSHGGGGDHKYWEDALSNLNSNLVDLVVCGGYQLSLSLLRGILSSAPTTLDQLNDPKWQEGACARALRETDELTKNGPPEVRQDFEECKTYWETDYAALAARTRSSITLGFTVLTRPLLTRPLRALFSSPKTNVRPEDTFAGKIIIVDLPVQEFRLAGRIANLIWKYCFQIAVLRRSQPPDRQSFLRPVFLWADEAQYFVSKFDAEYQAVARSAGGCTVYLTQNRESYLRVLGKPEAVDSLLGNLQCKFFCQNSGDTNEWAAKLLGERWLHVTSTNVGRSGTDNPQQNAGVTRSEQRRYFVEPSRFTTLKRGGEHHNFQVEAIVYNGGHQFPSTAGTEEKLPFKLITFNQR